MHKTRWIISLLCFSLSTPLFSWNAIGHRLIAQIAYEHLTVDAKEMFKKYNHRQVHGHPESFPTAAVWLDHLYRSELASIRSFHYIDIPFSSDDSPLVKANEVNAVWAINMATFWLLNPNATDIEKGIALRILLHVVGDVHQPLHTISNYSQQFPAGDHGGNLLRLGKNKVANNLHSYWDRGGGLLLSKAYKRPGKIRRMAKALAQRWPCDWRSLDKTPQHWAEESHMLALQKAYNLPPSATPDTLYHQVVRDTSEQRIVLAGCRLADLLNRISYKNVKKIDSVRTALS